LFLTIYLIKKDYFTVTEILTLSDFRTVFGGMIKKLRLWFFLWVKDENSRFKRKRTYRPQREILLAIVPSIRAWPVEFLMRKFNWFSKTLA